MEIIPYENLSCQISAIQRSRQLLMEDLPKFLPRHYSTVAARAFIADAVNLDPGRRSTTLSLLEEVHKSLVSAAPRIQMWVNELESIRMTKDEGKLFAIVGELPVQAYRCAALFPPPRIAEFVDLSDHILKAIGVLDRLRDDYTTLHRSNLVSYKSLSTPVPVALWRIWSSRWDLN